MQNYVIETDENGLELNAHGDNMFPLSGYDEYFSQFVLNEVPWHWHDEIELIVVIEGSTKVEYVEGSLELNQGDGLFINSSILHRMTQTSKIDCHIINFVLKPEFLGGRYDSKIYNELVRPICSNNSLSVIKFTSDIEWMKQFIDKVGLAFNVYTEKSFGHELLVKSHLLEAWQLLCINQKHLFEDDSPITENKNRLNKIIKYIHNNYRSKLPIKELANVAAISESECYRLFKKMLDTTPNDYILNHRLQIAALKLTDKDESILNIAYEVGFGNPSYFTKKFKEQYEITPKAFRKEYNNSVANVTE